jgi:hypothetical protein
MNPAWSQFLMLATLLGCLGLVIWIGSRAVRRRSVGRIAGVLVGAIAVYSAALVGASFMAGTSSLRPGDTKCFDEWCASMLAAYVGPADHDVTVQTRLTNHGRRNQRSILARAFIDSGGKRSWPQNAQDLHATVPGGESVDVSLLFIHTGPLRSPRFVVTEAASGDVTPGLIVIGDESSLFHPLAGWSLSLESSTAPAPLAL